MAEQTSCAQVAASPQPDWESAVDQDMQEESTEETMEEPVGSIDTSFRHRCRRFASLLRHPLLSLYRIETMLEGEPLKVLLADDGSSFEFVRNLVPDEKLVIYPRGWISALRAHNLIKSDADLVFVGANQLLMDRFAGRGFRIVPKWVKLYLPVEEEPYQRIYNKGRQARKYFKWMLKKSADAGFECEIATDIHQFNHFYYGMYKPYALERYGEKAVLYNYRTVRKHFAMGGLALAKRDGRPVVGTIMCKRGDILWLPHTGLSQDGMEAMRDGAAFALDYYLAQYAHKEGYKYVDFGHSRPMLSDGTLRYKMNWHMKVSPDDDCIGVFAVANPNNSPQGARFLEANPHFYLDQGRCRQSDEHP